MISLYAKTITLIILASLICLLTQGAEYPGKCFRESQLYGFNAKKYSLSQTDAAELFNKQLMEADMQVRKVRVCSRRGDIVSV